MPLPNKYAEVHGKKQMNLTIGKIMKHHLSTGKTNRGFTLVEAMIVIAILAIGAALAAPSFISQMQRSEVSRTAQDFYDALEDAKRKAYVSGRSFTVCPVEDITATEPTCSNWNKFDGSDKSETRGWIVFHDANKDKKVNNNETIVTRNAPNSNMAAMSWTGGVAKSTITLAPRNTTGSTGTMRVYAYKNGSLPAWSSTTPPSVSSDLHEMRVSLSALGRVKLNK